MGFIILPTDRTDACDVTTLQALVAENAELVATTDALVGAIAAARCSLLWVHLIFFFCTQIVLLDPTMPPSPSPPPPPLAKVEDQHAFQCFRQSLAIYRATCKS
jgi:hypothetical protein